MKKTKAKKKYKSAEQRIKETKKVILQKIENGMTLKDAAALAGIDESTLHRWKQKDASFASQILKAKIRYKEKLISIVNVRSVKDGKLALDVLARRWPDEWGARQQLEVVVDPQREIRRIIEMIDERLRLARRTDEPRQLPAEVQADKQ